MNDQSAKADGGKLRLTLVPTEAVEEWRDIPGYVGLYKVSNFGNVKTIKRQGTDDRILKLTKARNGYLNIALCKDGTYKRFGVHRLVAMAFLDNPGALPCVNHKDENKENNVLSNLEWCSHQYNNNYGTAKERATRSRYKSCVGMWEDGKIREFNSCTIASRETGISQGNIWGACNGLWKTAGGVRWKYA